MIERANVPPDPTGHDPLAFYLAYLHPLWMLGSLALAAATLRAGLALRRARLLGRRPGEDAYRRHLRLAKPTLCCVSIGFAAGLTSSVVLRGWDALHTAHGMIAVAALASFLVTGLVGWRMEHGRSHAVEWHARLAAVAVLLAAVAMGTGLVLLP